MGRTVVHAAAPVAGPAAVAVPVESVSIDIEEKLMVTLKKDGGLESMEVQGTMALEVANEEEAFIRVQIATGDNKVVSLMGNYFGLISGCGLGSMMMNWRSSIGFDVFFGA